MISNPAHGQYVYVWYRKSNRDLPYHGKMGWVEVAGKGKPRNHLIVMVDNFDSVIVPCGNLRDAMNGRWKAFLAQKGKKTLTDKEIKTIAKSCGFWGVDFWWETNIPRFRAFLERAEQEKG